MKQRNESLRRVPRPVRIVWNMLIVALLLWLIYVFLGSPSFTVERAYRREAARNAVDPGEIIAVLETDDCLQYDNLLIAETKEGYALYGVNSVDLRLFSGRRAYRRAEFSYREREDGATIMAAPCSSHLFAHDEYVKLPIVMFYEVPGAIRAELDLHLVDHVMYGEMEYHYSLAAPKKWDGCFVFELESELDFDADPLRGQALSILSEMYVFDGSYNEGSDFTADVRLYDRNDQLIYEESLRLRSYAGMAHEKRELP